MTLHLLLNQKIKVYGNGIRLIPCIYQISLGAQEYGTFLYQLFRKGRFFPPKFIQSFVIMTLLKHQGPNMEMYTLRRTVIGD